VSDGRLRELERRWRESGSVDDEASWLSERMRAGTLTRDRLELAAYCGSAAASKLVEPPSRSRKLRPFMLGLQPWGVEARVLAWIGCVSVAVARFAAQPRSGWDEVQESLPLLLRDLWAWFTCPCEDHAIRIPGIVESRYAGELAGFTQGLIKLTEVPEPEVVASIESLLLAWSLGDEACLLARREAALPWADER
jgi:hypothetical protein